MINNSWYRLWVIRTLWRWIESQKIVLTIDYGGGLRVKRLCWLLTGMHKMMLSIYSEWWHHGKYYVIVTGILWRAFRSAGRFFWSMSGRRVEACSRHLMAEDRSGCQMEEFSFPPPLCSSKADVKCSTASLQVDRVKSSICQFQCLQGRLVKIRIVKVPPTGGMKPNRWI